MSHSIGVIGAGAIVRGCHLPAYRDAGFVVAAIADADAERARQVAQEYGIPTQYASAEELLAHADVDVVDIAVPPAAQPAVALAALSSGRHVLCQKPLAQTLTDAISIANAAEKARLKVAVNQQLRWAPLVSAVADLLRTGSVGPPDLLSLEISTVTDWSPWRFLADRQRLDLLMHSIHFLDAIRFLLGEPRLVTAWGRRSPGQIVAGETITVTVMEFDHTLAILTVNHNDPAPRHAVGVLRLTGPQCAIEGRIGLYSKPGFPIDEPDRLAFGTGDRYGDLVPLPGSWFPGAFAGPMGNLLEAIDSGKNPLTNVRDNLRTMALVEAAYESMQSQRPVDPDRMLQEALAASAATDALDDRG